MKILVVEDSRALAAVLSARLDSFGHEVAIAENGIVAIEKFIKEKPDLILMDIEMPEMNGFEATSRIRALETTEQWAWTPIVFLTASDTTENLVTAIEAGGDDFMSKSVPERVLHAKMKAMARIANLRSRLTVANKKLAEQASRDGLTGLVNRREMDMRVDMTWMQAQACQGSFGLLMLDVDNFKKYNDAYGHQSGDDCLRAVATAIDNVVERHIGDVLTSECFAARYGGEEFSIVLPFVSQPICLQIADEILTEIRNKQVPHERNGDWGIVTASIGGIWVEKPVERIASLFRIADERLYKAKANGRNRAEF